jgi:hypothetical protein
MDQKCWIRICIRIRTENQCGSATLLEALLTVPVCSEFCRRLDIGEKYNNLSLETSAKLRDLARGISLSPHGGQQIRYNDRCFTIFFSSGRAVLRIRDVYPDPGSGPSRIRIREFKYFNPKKWFLSSRNMIRVVHSGSRIRILTFYPSRIPDPGVKKAPDPGFGSATLRPRPLI